MLPAFVSITGSTATAPRDWANPNSSTTPSRARPLPYCNSVLGMDQITSLDEKLKTRVDGSERIGRAGHFHLQEVVFDGAVHRRLEQRAPIDAAFTQRQGGQVRGGMPRRYAIAQVQGEYPVAM